MCIQLGEALVDRSLANPTADQELRQQQTADNISSTYLAESWETGTGFLVFQPEQLSPT